MFCKEEMGGTKEQLLCRTQAHCHKDLRCCVVVEVLCDVSVHFYVLSTGEEHRRSVEDLVARRRAVLCPSYLLPSK